MIRLAHGEVIPCGLPFRRAYTTARGSLSRRQVVLLRLSGEDGAQGWGEAVPMSLRGGDSLAQVVGDLEAWIASRLGQELNWRSGDIAGSDRSDSVGLLSPPARCAVLTALADLEGRRCGMPVWRLLGADRARPVSCNATLIAGGPAAVAADAAAWAAEGFATFKLKVGADSLAQDLAQIAAVREAVGPGGRIRIDANGAWSVEEAVWLLGEAAAHRIELAEQPVANLDAMAQLRRALSTESAGVAIPLAADESVNGAEQAQRAASMAACDLATVKLSKVGLLARPLGGQLPLYMSSALDGPVGIAAAAHALQAVPESDRARLPGPGGGEPEPIAHGLATQRLFEPDDLAERACELRDSLLLLPEGPGLGVELNRAALDRLRL